MSDGEYQTLTFDSDPEGAVCTLTRDGAELGKVTTPGQFMVHRDRANIQLSCAKDGYEEAKSYVSSKTSQAFYGNLLFGGVLGMAIDQANGADREYQQANAVTLTPKQGSIAGAPSTAASARADGPAMAAAAPARERITSTPKGPLPALVNFQAPPVGTKIYPDTGGYIEVTQIENRTVRTVNSRRSPSVWVGLFFTPGAPDSQMFDWQEAESIWPLQVGKSVNFNVSGISSNGSDGTWHITIKVVRQEQITTEAGQFQTVVVETRERSLGGSLDIVDTRWYAPEVGFIVKYRRDVVMGSSRPQAWTVNRITRPRSSSATADARPQATPVQAQMSAAAPRINPVDFKAPPVGTRVYLDTGGYLQVAAVNGRTVRTVNAASREADWVASFFIPGNTADSFDRALVESIWPLEAGKSVTFEISRTEDGAKRAWQETIKVLREEDITTDAGHFRTVVVEMRQRSLTGLYEAVMTRWYAPEVGFVIKSKLVVERGSGNASAWTATKIEKPGS